MCAPPHGNMIVVAIMIGNKWKIVGYLWHLTEVVEGLLRRGTYLIFSLEKEGFMKDGAK